MNFFISPRLLPGIIAVEKMFAMCGFGERECSRQKKKRRSPYFRIDAHKIRISIPKKHILVEYFTKNTERTVWRALKKFVKSPEDYKLFKNIFSTFHERFEKEWKKTNTTSLKLLEGSCRRSPLNEFLDTTAAIFGGGEAVKHTIVLIILFSLSESDQTAAGSANIEGNFITLELPVLKKNTWQLSYSLAVLGHEIGHRYFAARNGDALIKRR